MNELLQKHKLELEAADDKYQQELANFEAIKNQMVSDHNEELEKILEQLEIEKSHREAAVNFFSFFCLC